MPKIDIVIESFLLDGRARRLRPRTTKWYSEMLERFSKRFPDQDIGTITPTMIRRWVVELADLGLSGATQHAYARSLRALMNFATSEEHITTNPMLKVKMPKQDKAILPAFTNEEISIISDACKTVRDKTLFYFMLDTGLRVSETANLQAEDLQMNLREVFVRKGKGNKDRVTYFGESTKKQLARYFVDIGTSVPESGPVWLSQHSDQHPLTSVGIQVLFRRLRLSTGVEKCSAHTCRRTFAILNLRAGVNIFELARMMGHSDIKVLQRYLDVLDDDTKTAHRRAGAVDSVLGKL